MILVIFGSGERAKEFPRPVSRFGLRDHIGGEVPAKLKSNLNWEKSERHYLDGGAFCLLQRASAMATIISGGVEVVFATMPIHFIRIFHPPVPHTRTLFASLGPSSFSGA